MKKIFIFVLTLILLCGCSEKRITKQGFYFDTVINISAEKGSQQYVQEAMDKCRDFEKIFSKTDSSSELYKLNNGEITKPEGILKKVIDFGLAFSALTRGAFDITVSPLCDLWNIKERTIPPAESEINEALKNVGYSSVSRNPFSLNGRKIDLGAVAKGYIADNLIEFFKNKNAENIIIDLGGNVAVIGTYTVGIRSPFNTDEVFATFTLKNKSAVTSGAYQRYFEYNGKRYHHILDPRTGKCASNSIASVTVISPSSMHADALSTAIYVLGEDGLSLCKNFKDTDAIIIYNDKSVVFTDGFDKKYNLKIKKRF